jgi:hypothetical protein
MLGKNVEYIIKNIPTWYIPGQIFKEEIIRIYMNSFRKYRMKDTWYQAR